MERKTTRWERVLTWARGAALGVALYLLVLVALFFIFAQQESTFIYVGF